MRKREFLGGIGLFLIGATPAGFRTETLSVSAIVVGRCGISSPPIPLESLINDAGSPHGGFTVNCSRGTAYAVSLSEGLNGKDSRRVMIGREGAMMPYDIYRDSDHRYRWGSAAESQFGIGSGKSELLPAYTSIPRTPTAPHAYADVIIVTVAF